MRTKQAVEAGLLSLGGAGCARHGARGTVSVRAYMNCIPLELEGYTKLWAEPCKLSVTL